MSLKNLTPTQLEQLRTAGSTTLALDMTGTDAAVLNSLASLDREQLARLMTEQLYGAGQVLFQEGETGQAMYIIRSGRVAIVKGGFEAPTILGYRGPGEIIGEMALLEDRPRSAAVVALEELQVLSISRENFQQFLQSNPVVGMSILGALSSRLRAADEARKQGSQVEKQLTEQLSELESQNQQLLELERLRQETSDLIVHDLRNPLSLIAGAANLLELTLPEPVLQANRELLEMIDSNVERMKRLVESLLDVTKMEAGEVTLVRTELDLPLMFEHVIERTLPFLKSQNISVQFSVADDLPTVVADTEKISRVLANLMDNALKYTPNGGQVSLWAEEGDDGVLIRIINTGPIIPLEDRERIFERFARIPTAQAKARGFGLGLAFCRLAVEAHAGKIWVEPTPDGQGNRFTFTLPASRPADPLAAAPLSFAS